MNWNSILIALITHKINTDGRKLGKNVTEIWKIKVTDIKVRKH